MKKINVKSLKWKLAGIMFLYWVLPFLVIIGTIGIYMFTSQEKSQIERVSSQAELNNKICGERLEGVIADSRQATYDRTLFEKYRKYKRGDISEQAFYNGAQSYLESQYSHKKNNSIAVLMLAEDPQNKKSTSYNFGTGGSFQQIQTFFQKDSEAVVSYAEGLDTAVGFYINDGRLYTVRNMLDRNFKVWGILVNRVNVDYCFETILKFQEDFLVRLTLNGEPILNTGEEENWKSMPKFTFSSKAGYQLYKDRAYAFHRAEDDDFTLELVLNARKNQLFTSLYGYKYMILVMVLFLIPMLLLFFYLSGKYVSHPVEKLMAAAGEIEEGNLGYQLEGDTGSSEFEYLQDSFNHMSERLKYQFDHIYEEELALRDARIMALQSHINPHFMNNTLEIINWEARFAGNEKVSRMIGALSTILDAAMDRRNLPEVPLSEEMEYVTAYLYITCERLGGRGGRLVLEKELPGEVMRQKVPRLIMQPIIENAVEHGIAPRGSGLVIVRGRVEGAYFYLEIINDGELSVENEEKIERMLSLDYNVCREACGKLGIANVNQRLKILYGESCGLTIKRYGEDKTISTLTILASN